MGSSGRTISEPGEFIFMRKLEGLEERNDSVGGGEEIQTQRDLLRWDERSFFTDLVYKLESLDMQDVTGGMSFSHTQREREADSENRENSARVKKRRKSLRGSLLDVLIEIKQ